jgi:hypothetical protein
MFMPELSTEQYCAYGEFAYQFANLERSVTYGIMEGTDSADPKKLPISFERRVRNLRNALLSRSHLVHLRNDSFSFDQAEDLGKRRNSLLHGEPLTLVRISKPDPHGRVEFDSKHVNFNARYGTHIELYPSILRAMANEARDLAERLSSIVVDLAAARRHNGLDPITIGFGGGSQKRP